MSRQLRALGATFSCVVLCSFITSRKIEYFLTQRVIQGGVGGIMPLEDITGNCKVKFRDGLF